MRDGAHSLTSEPSYEISKLQQNILTSPWLQRFAFLAALVVRSKKNDGEAGFAMRLNFLDDCAPLVSLLMEDDRYEFYPL